MVITVVTNAEQDNIYRKIDKLIQGDCQLKYGGGQACSSQFNCATNVGNDEFLNSGLTCSQKYGCVNYHCELIIID